MVSSSRVASSRLVDRAHRNDDGPMTLCRKSLFRATSFEAADIRYLDVEHENGVIALVSPIQALRVSRSQAWIVLE
jgi:hypothetical protein